MTDKDLGIETQQDRLQELGSLEGGDGYGIEGSCSNIARKIINKQPFGIENLKLWYILEPNLDDTDEDTKLTIFYMQEKISKYVMNMAMSSEPEDQEKYRRFFDLDGEFRIFDVICERLKAAQSVLTTTDCVGIDYDQFRDKLFKDIYIKHGFGELSQINNLNQYLETFAELVSSFHNFDLTESSDIEILKENVYIAVRNLFLEYDVKTLAEKGDEITKLLRFVFERPWFIDEDIEENFAYDEEMLEELCKLDFYIRSTEVNKVISSPLAIFGENVTDFDIYLEAARRKNTVLCIRKILKSIDNVLDNENDQNYDEVLESVDEFYNIFSYEHKKTLDGALFDLFSLQVEGVEEQDFLVPFGKRVFLNLVESIKDNNDEYLPELIKEYLFLRNYMKLSKKPLN
jgi:hypothetical protein